MGPLIGQGTQRDRLAGVFCFLSSRKSFDFFEISSFTNTIIICLNGVSIYISKFYDGGIDSKVKQIQKL